MTTGSTFQQQSYDAAFLMALAARRRTAAARRRPLRQALRDVATAPGETILPGEWKKAVELIAAGTDINYEGASGPLEFDAGRRRRRRDRRNSTVEGRRGRRQVGPLM